ncbi:DoxX family protein [Nocardia goodfellowii]|uniref:Oxidoreductase n=1 Tax=Nocardia goodfellowii TaxID=882446 RepID=A0ABS4QS16_9NOCA|nr:DoxX family protein [Nocardia goodfellowii]MBP2194506.1 putative oxidoreductase [Nocardia goodfellowii]
MTTTTESKSKLATTSSLDGSATDIGLLAARVLFGGLMAIHGAQKLFGWFDGPGLEANNAGFEAMGYNPGKFFGTLAAISELGGGLLLLLGLATPLAAAIMIGTMINAINATWANGLFGTVGAQGWQPGYEMALLFAAAGVTLAFTGAGKYSLDYGRPWERKGFVIGAGAVALAVVAGVLTLILKWVL